MIKIKQIQNLQSSLDGKVSTSGAPVADNIVVRYDGVSGNIIQESAASILDSGEMVLTGTNKEYQLGDQYSTFEDDGSQNISIKKRNNKSFTIEDSDGGLTLHFEVDSTGQISVSGGHASGGGNLSVAGSVYCDELFAEVKHFRIKHPHKEKTWLIYTSLEGPENAVYQRGKGKGKEIYLPDYWEELVWEDSITVQITPIGRHCDHYIVSTDNKKVIIECPDDYEYFYHIIGERKDMEKLSVEKPMDI